MITILGGGIAGLLAAYVLRGKAPLLLEAAPKLGGNFLAGGLKYLRRTPEMIELLRELDIPWEGRQPRGKLHVSGTFVNSQCGSTVVDHPSWLNTAHPEVRHQLMMSHWVKTRGTQEGFRVDCMNDPSGNGADMMMECDLAKLVERLIIHAEVGGANLRTGVNILSIESQGVRTTYGMLAHTALVPTIPLAALSKLAPWANLPDVRPRALGIVEWVMPSGRPPAWDYMYHPLREALPGLSASRYTWPRPGLFQAEIPGVDLGPKGCEAMMRDATAEAKLVLAPWWGDSVPLTTDCRVIPGHLPPLAGPLIWPSNWHPLGRFTQWEPRATSERVLSDAIKVRAVLA